MEAFEKMQLERWSRVDVENKDTVYKCKVHNTTFDVELEPCRICWEDYVDAHP